MSRKDDLEKSIAESYEIMREYEAILRTSDRPEEKTRARRVIQEQGALIEGYQAELDTLTGHAEPREIIRQESSSPEPGQGTDLGATLDVGIPTAHQLSEPERAPLPEGKFRIFVGSDESPKLVELEGERLAERWEYEEGPFGSGFSVCQTLYRVADGWLVVHIKEIYEPSPGDLGRKTTWSSCLLKVDEDELTGAGRFAQLGIEAGVGRPLTLDEYLQSSAQKPEELEE